MHDQAAAYLYHLTKIIRFWMVINGQPLQRWIRFYELMVMD